MAPVPEVTIVAPDYWCHHVDQLIALLRGQPYAVADPRGLPPQSSELAILTVPSAWLDLPADLADALALAARDDAARSGSTAGSGIAPPAGDRLVFTVEEAAGLLGISRAFAYEAVQRGEIPSLRIGRRILVPKVALERLLNSAGGDPAN